MEAAAIVAERLKAEGRFVEGLAVHQLRLAYLASMRVNSRRSNEVPQLLAFAKACADVDFLVSKACQATAKRLVEKIGSR